MRVDIEVSPEVVALAGASGAAEFDQLASEGPYECPACQRPGTVSTDGTSAVIVRAANPPITILALAHRACLPSQVLDVASVTVRPDCDPVSYSWVSQQPGGPEARMLLDYPSGAAIGTPAGEEVDLLVTGLLEAGMELITNLDAMSPPPCAGLTAQIDGDVVIIWQRTTALFTGSLDRLRNWQHAAAGAGEIVVLAGADVFTSATRDMPGARGDAAVYDGGDLRSSLAAAVGAGRVVGGRVTVTTT
jgi:hypothetical protein